MEFPIIKNGCIAGHQSTFHKRHHLGNETIMHIYLKRDSGMHQPFSFRMTGFNRHWFVSVDQCLNWLVLQKVFKFSYNFFRLIPKFFPHFCNSSVDWILTKWTCIRAKYYFDRNYEQCFHNEVKAMHNIWMHSTNLKWCYYIWRNKKKRNKWVKNQRFKW